MDAAFFKGRAATRRSRLAVVTTHPIQYYAPWFRWITLNIEHLELKVFYLWDPQATGSLDPGFGRSVVWDVPLLSGYDYEFVPNSASAPGTSTFRGLRNPGLGSALKRWDPDAALLIGYRYESMARLIFTPTWRRGFPLMFRGDSHRIATTRNKASETLAGKVRRGVIASVFRRFAAFLYVGAANREYFKLHGVPDDKLFFAPHAVDNRRFMEGADEAASAGRSLRHELGIPSHRLLVLFAGKFEPKKRPLDLLHAFQRVGRSDVSLLFVGNGRLEGELREAASSVPNVYFAPFQNQLQMPHVYAAADLFVLPSYGEEETWGLAVNEVMCTGCPIIVSDHVGCGPDLVREGENGFVFPAGDVAALARALSRALDERDALRRMGEASRAIIQKYDYAHATAGLLRAFESVTADSRSRGR